MKEARLKSKLRLGFFIFASLVLIKIWEYLVATFVPHGTLPYLVVLALISAWLIVYFYKHIRDLWRPEESSDDK